MPITLSTVRTRFVADVNQFVFGIEQAQRALSRFATVAAGVAAGTVGALAGLTAVGVKAATAYETAEASIRAFAGSAQVTEDIMQKLREIAVSTPFDLQDLADSTGFLLAQGVAAEEVTQTLEDLSRVTLAFGGVSNDTFKRIARAFTQVAAKGHLAAEEVRQFTNANVPIVGIIARYKELSRAEVFAQIKAKAVSAADAIAALNDIADDPAMDRLMERLRNTFGFQMNVLENEIRIGLIDMFAPIRDELAKVIPPITEAFKSISSAAGPLIISVLMPMVQSVKDLVSQFNALDPKLRDQVVQYGLVATAALGVVAAFAALVAGAGSMALSVAGLIVFLKIALVVLGGIGLSATAALPAIIGLGGAALLLSDHFKKANKEGKSFSMTLWDMGAVAVSVGKIIVKVFDKISRFIMERMHSNIIFAINSLKTLDLLFEKVSGKSGLFDGALDFLHQRRRDAEAGLATSLEGQLNALFAALQQAIEDASAAGKNKFKKSLDDAGQAFEGLFGGGPATGGPDKGLIREVDKIMKDMIAANKRREDAALSRELNAIEREMVQFQRAMEDARLATMEFASSLVENFSSGNLGGAVDAVGQRIGTAAGVSGPMGAIIMAALEILKGTEIFARAQERLSEGVDRAAELMDTALKHVGPMAEAGHGVLMAFLNILEPLVKLGTALNISAPAIKLLTFILEAAGRALEKLATLLNNFVSSFLNKIGKILNINFKDKDARDGVTRLGDAANETGAALEELTNELINIPDIFKTAQARFLARGSDDDLISIGGGGSSGGDDGLSEDISDAITIAARGGGNGTLFGKPVGVPEVTVHFHGNVGDPHDAADLVAKAAHRNSMARTGKPPGSQNPFTAKRRP